MDDTTATSDDATDVDDVDDQFRALLEGLRTSLPGVQVLFAFLLTAPLQSRFAELGGTERIAFGLAFYGSGLASVLLIAPSVHQRLRAPITGLRRRSRHHLVVATWVAIAGTLAMAVAVAATAFLVSRLAFQAGIAASATVLLTASLVWAWFYLPLVTFRTRDREA